MHSNSFYTALLINSSQFDECYKAPAPLPEKLDLQRVSVVIIRNNTDPHWGPGSPAKPKGFALSFIQQAVRGQVESEHANRNPWQELIDYIKSALAPDVHDPVKWWGVRKFKWTR